MFSTNDIGVVDMDDKYIYQEITYFAIQTISCK